MCLKVTLPSSPASFLLSFSSHRNCDSWRGYSPFSILMFRPDKYANAESLQQNRSERLEGKRIRTDILKTIQNQQFQHFVY